MLQTYGIRGFTGKCMHISHIYVHWQFNYCKNYIRRVHSLHRFKHNKSVQPMKRKIRKLVKSGAETEDKDPKVYTRDTIGNISKILRYLTWDSAQEQLEKLCIRWDSYTINQVLKTHPPMEKAWLFFNWASRLKGFKHDQFTYTTMLDIFGEAGRISSMKYVFQLMQEKDIKIDAVTYTSLLHWFSKDGDVEGSLKTWEEMKAKGCSPTVVSYTAFMKVLFDHNRPKDATDVYKEMLESGCSPNCYTYTVLMEYLAGAGKFKAALEILGKMQEAGVQPDKATCNILVQKCCRAGETWAMGQILRYMKENSLVLRYPVYKEALETLKIAGESVQLIREVNPHISFESVRDGTSEFKATPTDVHSTIDRGIVFNLLMNHNFIAVEHLLNGMIDKSTVLDSELISTIIQVHCAHRRPTGALLAFEYSVKVGINIEKAAYLALIGLFIRTNSFLKVVEIVEEMFRAGVAPGTYLLSLLIYKLGCARKPSLAAKIFYTMPDDQNNTVTYTALMGAYFSSRNVDKGIEIYKTMRSKGIHVANCTYKVLLVGLEKAGRLREAGTYKKEMKSLQNYAHSRESFSMEERLCELIFAGDVAT
ncbi:hypothetical protein HHK36_002424 [Tetracentron sinense]|uniref:Pentatricopeptide repeat-containing protein n=1 Tax=Tetracentron sinense TaxID=13715 RepID=A0A834ZQA0_TETSI|nr:hypothetical protein HHK36_002424 [Tetracentron sinense]